MMKDLSPIDLGVLESEVWDSIEFCKRYGLPKKKEMKWFIPALYTAIGFIVGVLVMKFL